MRAVATVVAGLAITATMSLVPVTRAYACSCAPPNDRENFDAAEIIFEGVVVKADKPLFLQSSGDPVAYTFSVETVIKGEATSNLISLTTAASGASCGEEFQLGERWRVFARADGEGLTTGLCIGNRLLDQSAPIPSGSDEGASGHFVPAVLGLGVIGLVVAVVLLLFGRSMPS